jgi:hypothetical protein
MYPQGLTDVRRCWRAGSDSVTDAFDCKHDAPEPSVFGGAIAGSISTSSKIENSECWARLGGPRGSFERVG